MQLFQSLSVSFIETGSKLNSISFFDCIHSALERNNYTSYSHTMNIIKNLVEVWAYLWLWWKNLLKRVLDQCHFLKKIILALKHTAYTESHIHRYITTFWKKPVFATAALQFFFSHFTIKLLFLNGFLMEISMKCVWDDSLLGNDHFSSRGLL
ncbi:hypothetical protein FF38_07600 [Lucilia cuprina]|uniref:Uncharacterized protein n=1 Tax=Lucilia cuprina TaxID=7375 RepID=A0A0L0BZD1_LUCCU|nr:hypothetical protein FF38_07600 [Lucilia cuprina]